MSTYTKIAKRDFFFINGHNCIKIKKIYNWILYENLLSKIFKPPIHHYSKKIYSKNNSYTCKCKYDIGVNCTRS